MPWTTQTIPVLVVMTDLKTMFVSIMKMLGMFHELIDYMLFAENSQEE